MEKVSAIIPCYNEEQALPFLYEELNKVAQLMSHVEFEFILVNDGSKDKTLEVIKDLRKKDDRIRYVSFSRNFGKEAAIYAGLQAAKGDFVAMLDADLQDPPHLMEYKNVIGRMPYMYELSEVESVDIDTEFDFEVAEFLYKKKYKID